VFWSAIEVPSSFSHERSMADRFFLYIDILGFRQLMKRSEKIEELYRRIDRLNVHSDDDFTAILFSDTLLVYAHEIWNEAPNRALMWLTEFAQNLFYELAAEDVHFRAFITHGDFNHKKLGNVEYYYGDALVHCYEQEKKIKCSGVFIDDSIVKHSDIFKTNRYSKNAHFAHIMQHLDDISYDYESYPISGEYLEATGMEWWVAYLLVYLKNIWSHSQDLSLSDGARQKYQNTWLMISQQHDGLLRRLVETKFEWSNVVEMDWTEPMSRIGTKEGAWG